MTLSIIFILLLLLIAYWHLMQGMFSGFISAVLAVIAGAAAFSYFEPLANVLAGGKFNDMAHGVCLLSLFAGVYLLLRTLFDSMVPGNIRVNSTFDKIGGAIFGVVAGMVGLGIAAVSMQYMPFGPSVGGYSRYALLDARPVRVVTEGSASSGSRQVDRKVNDEVKADRLETGETSGMLVPFDDFVVGLFGHLSDGGALASDKPLKSIHPDLIQELFAQRIGIEPGAKHTATNKKTEQVKLVDVHVVDAAGLKGNPRTPGGKFAVVPSEIKAIREKEHEKPMAPVGPDESSAFVIAGVTFHVDAADELDGPERLVRVGASGVRLVAKGADGQWRNHYPIGTFEDGKIWANRPDDFLLINAASGDVGARFVFEVEKSAVTISGGGRPTPGQAPARPTAKFEEGTFLEVKRMVKFDLAEKEWNAGVPADNPVFWPVRKTELKKPRKPPVEGENPPPVTTTNPPPVTPDTPPVTPDTPPTPPPPVAMENGWNEAPFADKPALVTPAAVLPVAINIGEDKADAEGVVTAAGTEADVKGRKFTKLVSPPSAGAETSPAELAKPPSVRELAAPAGQQIVQVRLTPKTPADWGWADRLGEFAVVDSTGAPHKPRGAFVVGKTPGGDRVSARFDPNTELGNLAKVEGGTANDVRLFFVIPAGSRAVELRFQEKAGGPKL
ncbi:MAG TPA: CvpA family protein [Tepidisphaeraceae bacterium]|nr:CvpA family protein [Tepidisphaeraceae bacterium]